MDFSNEQKVILALLADIHAAIGVENGLDADFILDKAITGRTWAIRWQYGHLFSGDYETPAHVKLVADVLDLWEGLEYSFENLEADDKDRLRQLSPIFGEDVKFRGFDGNGGDRDAYGTASILINEMGRWSCFQGRDLNAHMPTLESYERMLNASRSLEKEVYDRHYSVEEIALILNAREHSSGW